MAVSSHHIVLKPLAARLHADLAAMTDETEGLLHREQPALFARVDPAVRREGIAFTHARFADRLAGADDDGGRERHMAFGAAMAAAGLSVDELLACYRVGAQVGWRHATAHARDLGLDADAVLAFAEAVMSYNDALATDSVDGFAHAARAAARDRQALLEALMDGRADRARALGEAAGWPVPATLRVAVPLGDGALDERAILVGQADGAAVAVAADVATLRAAGADGPAGVTLAIGPEVPAEQAPLSLARARRVAALMLAGALPGDGPLVWDEHLVALVLHADDAAAGALAARLLAPLDKLPAARAAMLRETLAAWLDHPGRPREIARALHLHHQTVRYRLARLRERLGDAALDDPEARFALGLALRWRGGGGAGAGE
jgi:PucR C-terminal helix-turn-helix domain